MTARAPLDGAEARGELAGMEWEYFADESCPVGRELHGRRFASLAEVYEHLPDLGPNPACPRACSCTVLPSPVTPGV